MARKFKSMDGNEAAAWVSYAYTEVAGIYPITPSSPMADHVDQWAAQGLKNVFGTPVNVVEMESEAGASGTVHGSLGAGALTTTYTASQGLLLMIPNMYKIAGERPAGRVPRLRPLPSPPTRSTSSATTPTSWPAARPASPCSPRATSRRSWTSRAVAHLAAIKGRVPFLNFFDGFRTSHEIQKVAMWDYDDLKDMLRHGCRPGLPRPRPEPRAPACPRLPRERRHLLPAP